MNNSNGNHNGNGHAKRVMTIREVSEFLKIPVSTLYELTKQGKIPGSKFGKHWRYLEEDILACFHNGLSAKAR